MEMWRYAAELKQPYPNAKLPFHHFPHKSGVYYGVEIKTNSQGFREREYVIPKDNGKKRVVVLGDSFTLGWGVPFENIFSKQVERLLNANEIKVEVANLGIGNYNTSMEVELFKLKGIQLDPDLVILAYFVNDAEPTPAVTTSLEYSIIKHSYLIAFLFDRYIKIKAVLDANYDWRAYYSGLYKKEAEGLSSTELAIRELSKLCTQRKIKLLVVNIPELRMLKHYPFRSATAYIHSLAERENIPFLDLLPEFVNEDPISLWVSPEDPHANSKANAIMAQAIFRKIMEDKLL